MPESPSRSSASSSSKNPTISSLIAASRSTQATVTAPYVISDVTAPSTSGPPIPHVGRLSLTWAGLPRLGIAGPRADEDAQAPVSGFACASREVEAYGERGIYERAMVLDCVHLDLMPAYAQVPLIAPGCCHSADPMTENGPISSDCARWICTVAT